MFSHFQLSQGNQSLGEKGPVICIRCLEADQGSLWDDAPQNKTCTYACKSQTQWQNVSTQV